MRKLRANPPSISVREGNLGDSFFQAVLLAHRRLGIDIIWLLGAGF